MNKVVIVTGGSRGIGAATSRLLAEQGYGVCVNYRSRSAEAEALVADITAGGGRAFAHAADVSQEGEVPGLFNAAEQVLGPVTHLVNNAGMLAPQARLAEMELARFARVLNVNVIGCCPMPPPT